MGTATGQRVWRVLVVDDEENLNWSLVTSLRKDNYAADGALTGDDALRRMAAQTYDIVISDVKMPGMDGFELLQWLRAHRPQTRVLMMTAFGSPTDRAEALRGGVIAYLEKPFDLRALKDELRRLTEPGQGRRPTGSAESEGYDLVEVARVIGLARRDIALVVEAAGRAGRLRFLRGDLIWAEAGDLTGDEAFIALTSPRSGRVQPEPWDGRSTRNVTQPLSHLIHASLAQREHANGDSPSISGRPAPAAAPIAPQPSAAPDSRATPAPGPTYPPQDGASGRPMPSGPTPSTAPLSPLSPAQMGAARSVLDLVAAKLPEPALVALVRPDGTTVAQRSVGVNDASSGTLSHLASCAQAALRALLLGGWGELEDVQVTSQDQLLLLRRLGRTDRAAILILVMPRATNSAACQSLLREHELTLVDALR